MHAAKKFAEACQEEPRKETEEASQSTEPPYGPEWAAAAAGTDTRRVGHSDKVTEELNSRSGKIHRDFSTPQIAPAAVEFRCISCLSQQEELSCEALTPPGLLIKINDDMNHNGDTVKVNVKTPETRLVLK